MAELDITVKGVDSVERASSAIAAGTQNTKSLKAQLRELQSELASLDPNSDKFLKLSQQAGELKDKMNDAAEATRASAGPAFEQLGNNASLLTQRLGNLDFEGVSQSVKALASNITNVKFKDIVGGIKGMTSAFSALGKALLANPIFLLVSALVAIGMAIKGILDQQRADVDAANEAIDKSNEKRHLAEKKRLAEAGNDLQKQRELKEEFARKDIEATQKQIDNLIKLQRKPYGLSEEQEKKLDELRKQLAEQRVNYEIEAINRLNQLNEERSKIQTRYENIGLSQREVRKKELEKAYQDEVARLIALGESTEELYKVDAYYEAEINKLVQEAEKEKADARRAAAEKAREAREREQAELLKSQEEVSDLIAQLEAEQLAAELEADRVRRESEYKSNLERLEREEQYYTLSEELRLASLSKEEAAREKEIADLVAQYDEKYLLAEGNAELERQLAEQQAKDIDAINAEYANKEIERQQQINDKKYELAAGVFGALQQLNDAFQNGSERSARRAFAVSKGLSLAQAAMDTYKAVNAVLADPTLVGPARWIAAGTALASGLANVAKISKTKFEGGSGSSAPSGGGGSISAPSGVGSTQTNNTPNFTALNPAFLANRPNQSPTVQAYVVSGNVSSELEASTKIKDKSRL